MRLSLIALALTLVAAGEALACTCVPIDLERALPRADGAFVGTLLEASPRGTSEAVYRFRVEQIYRGDIESRIDVLSARDSAGCGLAVQVGDRIGLLLDRDGTTWRSSLCSQVDPSAFLELTDVDDNSLPAINWGGYVIGTLILGAGAFFLVRRLRRYRAVR